MKALSKKFIICCLTVGFLLSVLFFGIAFDKKTSKANVITENFLNNGISLKTDVFDTAQDRNGLAFLSSSSGGSSVLMKNGACAFDFDFNFYNNEANFLSDCELIFSDAKDLKNTFSIRLTQSENEYMASVVIDGKDYGIYYKDGVSRFLTKKFNEKGYYTCFSVTERTVLSFDPETMCVYIKEGIVSKKLVWDLSSTINDGLNCNKNFETYDNYSVELKFNSITKSNDFNGKVGLVVFAINNQDLSGKVFGDSAKPGLHANIIYKAIKNQNYVLPKPFAFDVKDGVLETVNVIAKQGASTLYSGVWVDGCSVDTNSSDVIEIIYSVSDNDGRVTSKTYQVECLNASDVTDYETVFSSSFEDCVLGKNSQILLPEVKTSSSLLFGKNSLKNILTVKKDGNVVEGYNGVQNSAGETFVFEESGSYSFEYTLKNYPLSDKKIVTVTVVDDEPSFKLNDQIKNSYELNSTFYLPEYSFIFNETVLETEAKLIYPSGKVESANSSVLNEVGKYALVFSAQNGVSIHQKVYEFNVCADNFNLEGKVTAAYGVMQNFDNLEGVLLSFQSNADRVTFNKVINLNDFSKDNPFLSFYALPQVQGTADMSEFCIDIIDLYDETNVLTIKFIKRAADITWSPSYVVGAVPSIGQEFVGYYGQSISTTGAMTFIEFGKYNGAPYLLSFDNETLTAWTSANGSGGTTTKIAEFGSDACYDTLWDGFTTGEVIVSLYVSGVSGTSDVLITKLGNGELRLNDIETNYQPKVKLQVDKDNVPYGKVGIKYNFFDYQAEDVFGNVVKAEIKPYFNGLEYVCDDSGFVPTEAGTYVIRYNVKDAFGNSVSDSVTVEIKTDNDDIDLIVYNFNSQAFVGTKQDFNNYLVFSGCGDATVQVSVTNLRTGKKELIEDEFVFTETGYYQVDYVASDYLLRTKEITKYIQVKYEQKLYGDEVALPFVFLSNAEYDITAPDVYCYENNAKTFVDAQVYVFNNGRYTLLDGKLIVKNIIHDGFIKIKVLANKNGYESFEKEYSVKVVSVKDDGGIIFENYFVVDNGVTVAKEKSGISLTAGSGTHKYSFINPIVAEGFKLTFSVRELTQKEINVYLKDSLNSSITLKATIKQGEDGSLYFSANGMSRSVKISGSFADESQSITLRFDNLGVNFFGENNFSYAIQKDFYGNQFGGFPSGKIYFEIETENQSTIIVNNINNQPLNVTSDRIKAEFAILGDYGGEYSLGSKVKTSLAIVGDVLSYETSFIKMTVYDNDGNVMTDVNGKLMKDLDPSVQYEFICNDFGEYSVEYEFGDGVNASRNDSYLISIIDTTPPKITLNSQSNYNVKVGETLSVPQYNASDESGINRSYVMLQNEKGIVSVVKEDKIKFEAKGQYYINIVVYDNFDNMSVKQISVVVE